MSAPLLTGRRRLRQQLAGLLFLAVLAALVGTTVALYQKSFTEVTTVYVDADRIGNQLTKGADVKARGLLVGEVRDVSSTGRGARIELALDPAQAQRLPSDLRAQMLPKTLFGEKFVSLVPDDDSRARPLHEGSVIAQDHSETARETAEALDGLLPLLQTLRPQDLSVTLNALSTALRGRGNRLGQSLELTDTYLKGINPELPTLSEDFRGIADFANTLDEASPDFLAVLDNTSALARDLVESEQPLSTFLKTTSTSNGELSQFLEDNDDRLIRLAADGRPNLELFAQYASELPCLAKGLVAQEKVAGQAFGGLQPGLHITVEFIKDQGGYQPGDEPVYGEDGPPTCRGLPPNAPERPFPADIEVTDGYCDEAEKAPGIQNGCHGSSSPAAARASATRDPAQALAAPRDLDRRAVGAVAGPVLGVAPSDVPDLAILLFGPVARGTAVSLTPRG